MFDKDAGKRFEEIHKKGMVNGNSFIVDRETGVHYLFSWSGNAGGHAAR